MTSFQTYMIGFIVLIIGLAAAAYLLGVATEWIVVGAIVMIGIGIIAAAGYADSRGGKGPPY